MILTHLTDEILIEDTKKLILIERKVLSRLLYHLAEIDRRKLFCDYGFSSLYDYMTRGLKYSESAAMRRIQVARLLVKHPQIENKIETGKLTLTTISQAATLFKNHPMNKISQSKVLAQIENKSTREVQKDIFEITNVTPYSKDRTQAISVVSYEIKATIDSETHIFIEEYKALTGEQNMNLLLKNAFNSAVTIKKNKQFHLITRPFSPPAPAAANGRVPTAEQKRSLYKDQKVCSNCGGNFKLQIDHIKPYALGGETRKENLRLLCFNCNQRGRIRAGLSS